MTNEATAALPTGRVVCFVRLVHVELKVTLSPKLLTKPLADAVVNPFLAAYSKKTNQDHVINSTRVNYLTIDGQPLALEELASPASASLPGPEHRVVLQLAALREDDPPDVSDTNCMDDAVDAQAAKLADGMRKLDTRSPHGANFVSQLASDEDAATAYAKELVQAPSGWGDALQRLWDHIMRADKEGGPPGDPLTPLTARLLLSACEPQGKQPPKITKAFLLSLLANPAELRAACKTITEGFRANLHEPTVAQGGAPLTKQATARLDELVDRGTTLALISVRKLHAQGGLPVRVWDERPPAGGAAGFVRVLPSSTTPEELWEAAVRPHRPCVVRGAFESLVELLSPPSLASRFGDHRVAARRRFRVDTSGRRVFTEAPHDEDAQRALHFGEWVLSAAAGEASAKEAYPAKMPLRHTLPELERELMRRDDTPLAKYGACVGALNKDGLFMYAGAGANTTHTHLDPAENFLLVARGSKRMQLFAPADYASMYPFPAPKYHSSAVPPFTPPIDAPVEFPAYARTRPVEIELRQGDLLYLPAYWYHCVAGGDDFNVVVAWWTTIHANKRDDAPPGMPFDPVRRNDADTAGALAEGVMMDAP